MLDTLKNMALIFKKIAWSAQFCHRPLQTDRADAIDVRAVLERGTPNNRISFASLDAEPHTTRGSANAVHQSINRSINIRLLTL